MQKLFLAISMVLLIAGSAVAHGNISKLPDTVQILQYKMKLYMNADDADTKNDLAMAYFRTNQLDEAKKELASILEMDANNFDALDGMGIVLIKKGNSSDALEYLHKAQSINDKDIMIHVHLSVAHSQLQQTDLARSEMAKAKTLATGTDALDQIEKEVKLITNP